MLTIESIHTAADRFLTRTYSPHLYARLARSDIEGLETSTFLVLARVQTVANVSSHCARWQACRAGLLHSMHKSTVNRAIGSLAASGRVKRVGRRQIRYTAGASARPVRISFLAQCLDRNSALVGRFLALCAFHRGDLARMSLRGLRARLAIGTDSARALLAWLKGALAAGLRRRKLRAIVFRSVRAWDFRASQDSPDRRSCGAPISGSSSSSSPSSPRRSLTCTARGAPAPDSEPVSIFDIVSVLPGIPGAMPERFPAGETASGIPLGTLRHSGARQTDRPGSTRDQAAPKAPQNHKRRGEAGSVFWDPGARDDRQEAAGSGTGKTIEETDPTSLQDLPISEQLALCLSPRVKNSPSWRSFFLSQK